MKMYSLPPIVNESTECVCYGSEQNIPPIVNEFTEWVHYGSEQKYSSNPKNVWMISTTDFLT